MTPKTPSGKKIKVDGRFRQENLMLSSYKVKQVNIILLVVGSLIPKSCKLSNDHLFKKGNEAVWILSSNTNML